jgi:tetratricopeptide (TPR) repeat protein
MKLRQIVTMLAILTMVAVCVQPVWAEPETTDEATYFYNIAQQSIAIGDYPKALEYFDKVLASNTTNLSMGDGLMYTYKDRSGVLADLGRYDEAVTAADEGLRQYPNSSGLWNNKGYAYYKAGRYNEAVDAYTNALRIDPAYLKGWINKGNALMKAGRAGEAADAYRKALELDSGNADAAAGLEAAQKEANTSLIVIAVIAVLAIGAVILYVRFRNKGDEAFAEKAKGKK